mgnify:CR=1 FL=1|tara:strand:+ start:1093 stop:1326 length:234 start_codon:yes stop_codon:yes gene_type:complete
MRITLDRNIELDKEALLAFMSDLGYDDEIEAQGEGFVREYVKGWIWLQGSVSLEEHVMKYVAARSKTIPTEEQSDGN